jgi:RNA polymerase sigma-70 factor (ECF subfamily)
VTGGASELSDGAVVRAGLDGRADLYGVLVDRYQDSLYRYAERMTGRPDEASDIVQASFVKAYENLDHCRNAERVGAWLFRINVNQCKDYLKDRRRKDVKLDDAARLLAEQDDPEMSAERRQLRDEIARALYRLTEDEREAFVLKHLEGFSYHEMSKMLKVSVPALKMRVHRAREELQILLEDYE